MSFFNRNKGASTATAAAVAPSAVPSGIALTPSNAVNVVELNKKLETQAPELVNLSKSAGVSLAKTGLQNHTAKVALCLDVSWSMDGLYSSGIVQRLAERVLALGLNFDDDGSIDVFTFGGTASYCGGMDLNNFRGFVNSLPMQGATNYSAACRLIREVYFANSGQRVGTLSVPNPVYVMFVTDGDTSDRAAVEEQMRWSSAEPIFWEFMGVGGSTGGLTFLQSLDNLSGRMLDNAHYFNAANPDQLSDTDLYDLMLTEYPAWVNQVKSRGLVTV